MPSNLAASALRLFLVTSLIATLGACGASQGAASSGPSAAGTPAAQPDVAPEPTEEAAPAPVADEHSQVVNGVLYQGTEIAPVRIGTDTPGQVPAAEAGFVAAEGWEGYAEQADKYVVSLFPGYSDNAGGTEGGHVVGWTWKVFGLSRHGSFRELDSSGYERGVYLPSREAALAGPYSVDGRVLDRAEYILAPIADRYADIP